MIEWIFFGATVLVSVTGFLISREINRMGEEIKHLRQDVFRLSVDLAKLEERLDSNYLAYIYGVCFEVMGERFG
jgi:hypothetical protein